MSEADFTLRGDAASFEIQVDYDEIRPAETEVRWLSCHCSCRVDDFHAAFPLDVTIDDFEHFRDELTRLASGNATEVELKNLEDDFTLRLTVRSTGAVIVAGELTPRYTLSRARLQFAFDSDLATVDAATRRIARAITQARKLT